MIAVKKDIITNRITVYSLKTSRQLLQMIRETPDMHLKWIKALREMSDLDFETAMALYDYAALGKEKYGYQFNFYVDPDGMIIEIEISKTEIMEIKHE